MKIVNLTPHKITFFLENGVLELEASSQPFRLQEKIEKIGEINSIPITKTTYIIVSENLPEKKENIIYIVPKIILENYPERDDFYMVNQTIKNENGHIVGCQSLTRLYFK